MSSEERIIRPYEGLDRAARLLDGSFVQMAQNHRIEPGGTIRVTPGEYMAFPAQLWLAPDEAGLAQLNADLQDALGQAGLESDQTEFVAVLSTTRLRHAEIVWRRPGDTLADASPFVDLTGDPRRLPFSTPFGGCRVDVYLLLASDLEEGPLRPWRKGTWLARAHFEIKTDLGDVGFIPIALTDELRSAFGLPARTIRYAEVDDPFATDSAADTVKMYVDESILSQLAHQPSSPAAKAFQRQLFVDAMSALVNSASASDEIRDKAWGDVEDAVLGRLISRLAGPSDKQTKEEHRSRCESLLRDVADQPARVIAWIEDIVPDLREGQLDLLRGES